MKKHIDATLTLKPGMRGVKFDTAKTIAKDGWNAKTLHLYSHCGTHMDAPVHFAINDFSIDQYPVHRFFSLCHVVKLDGIQPGTGLSIHHLGDIANTLKRGEGLIFRTGWSQFVNEDKYRNELPGITVELAKWCVEKGVSTIGVEPPSVADVTNMSLLTEVHKILLEGDIVIIEGLCNLEQITVNKVQMISLPLKVMDGDGAPARVILIEDSL
jgi:arylformamidase